jgi:hypothetical protein
VLCDVSSRNINAPYAVRNGEALVYWDGMGDTIAAVEYHACCSAAGVEGEDCLDGGVEGGDVECLEENLGRCVAVASGVEGRFG